MARRDYVMNSAIVLTALFGVGIDRLCRMLKGSELYERLQDLACHDCICQHEDTCGGLGIKECHRTDCRFSDPVASWMYNPANAETFNLYYRNRLLYGQLFDTEIGYPDYRPEEVE